jgi:hypothetical protein
LTPSKAARFQAASLEAFAAAARAEVVAAKLLFEEFVTMYETHAAFHIRFGRKTAATPAHRLEERAGRSDRV